MWGPEGKRVGRELRGAQGSAELGGPRMHLEGEAGSGPRELGQGSALHWGLSLSFQQGGGIPRAVIRFPLMS